MKNKHVHAFIYYIQHLVLVYLAFNFKSMVNLLLNIMEDYVINSLKKIFRINPYTTCIKDQIGLAYINKNIELTRCSRFLFEVVAQFGSQVAGSSTHKSQAGLRFFIKPDD